MMERAEPDRMTIVTRAFVSVWCTSWALPALIEIGLREIMLHLHLIAKYRVRSATSRVLDSTAAFRFVDGRTGFWM